jgi:hypothetical protein
MLDFGVLSEGVSGGKDIQKGNSTYNDVHSRLGATADEF